ncbi:RadC family protein [Companilactobacillus jidongensis]|uniref:RadC family protein n=1 Tax=Companilactobacillus jidongensis TaxID=2486006 RepID=UPI001CDD8F3B|nr:DNA repair protein RadC [Companilactobacillus jidongensis]
MVNLRERITKNGIKSLGTNELVAVILGNGTKGQNVIELADEIVLKSQNLNLNMEQLISHKGIGIAQACKILAALELGQRKLEIDSVLNQIVDLSSLSKHLIKKIGNSPQEKLVAVYLDNGYHVIAEKIIFVGTTDAATVHPRDIIREALYVSATQIVVAHNHPSGRNEPSENDKNFSLRLLKCCQLMGINLIDHIIVTKNTHSSLKSQKII